MIHCVDGDTRAPALILGKSKEKFDLQLSAYLMLKNNMDLNESFQKVLSKRPSMNVPSSLMRILSQMEKDKFGFTSMTATDWNIQRPNTGEDSPKTRNLSKAEIEDICLNHATLEVLLDSVEQVGTLLS